MPTSLAILVIHGMGAQEPSYADGLMRRLTERLGASATHVEIEACYWAPILQTQQDATWRKLLASNRMDAKAVRRWALSALGDPATYLSGFFKAGQPVYGDVHACVRASLAKLAARIADPTPPLLVLAHSLGGVIVSNYLWDEWHGRSIGQTAFERGETLTGLVTYGCNIPMFLPPSSKVTCIRFPSPNLPPKYKPVAAWTNVYDPDDVLGYPLSGIWDDTQQTVINDKPINAGMWPVSETPFSHIAYDRDDDFLDIVETEARKILSVQ